MGEPSDTDSDLSVSERNTTRSGRDFDVCRTGMVAEMQTRLKVNQLKNEIARIKATFKANPVTDFNDARVARINELFKLLPREKLVGKKASDKRTYYDGRRLL